MREGGKSLGFMYNRFFHKMKILANCTPHMHSTGLETMIEGFSCQLLNDLIVKWANVSIQNLLIDFVSL